MSTQTTHEKAQHTPGPWKLGDRIDEYQDGSCWVVPVWSHNGPNGGKIAAEGIAPSREMARANAELIATSANRVAELTAQRDALLEACKKAMTCSLDSSVREVVRRAIAQATGNSQ